MAEQRIKQKLDELLWFSAEQRAILDNAYERLDMAFARKNADHAHRIIDEAMADFRIQREERLDLDSPIAALKLPVRVVNLLELAGYTKARALVAATDAELQSVRLLDRQTVSLIRARLAHYGFIKPGTY